MMVEKLLDPSNLPNFFGGSCIRGLTIPNLYRIHQTVSQLLQGRQNRPDRPDRGQASISKFINYSTYLFSNHFERPY
jgi:hypothetical protein